MARTPSSIAAYIDHTLLRAEATSAELDRLCDEARAHHFAAVCVNPIWVERCAERLAGSDVTVCSVIAFPSGAAMTGVKVAEAGQAVRDGAGELDMVVALGHVKGGDWRHVHDDIAAVVRAAGGALVKVIIETAILTQAEIATASAVARDAGAHFVKTSTGFHRAGGATTEAVAAISRAVGDAAGVKAAGGVRDCPTALRMIAHGATRIGTSSGVAIASCLGTETIPVGAEQLLTLAREHAVTCSARESG